ncbi:MAG: 2Fe-2S iron-sulfur cluster binding domain-containing protein [Treponema sp.]|jgi:carbon-monoxide dehydrogenase small subunit|nr:2Fe-2S iron-sulfur cluster binding domain-containing protein [Treponema sp.]
MTIGFILNGEDVVVRAEADMRLINILRNHFGLLGTKSDCLAGKCGVCSVIFNGEVIKSCLVPAFRVRGSEVITIEGFSQTDEYQDIIAGFLQAGLETCGFCRTGKILTTTALLERKNRPSREEILLGFDGIRCRCTDPEILADAITAVAEIRQRRLYGRSA